MYVSTATCASGHRDAATPRPPLTSATERGPGDKSKPCPRGPRQLMIAPASIRRSCPVPAPTALRTTSMWSPSVLYTENGRRSNGPPAQPRLTNWPARTDCAISGASIVSTNMPRATSRRAIRRESSRNTGPPLLDGADLHLVRHRRRRFEQRRRCVERGETRDAPLDSCAPDLKTILEHRAAGIAGIGVDVRHRVDDEVDLAVRDRIEHRRTLLADLGHHPRRKSGRLQRPCSAFSSDERAAHLHETRDDGKDLGLVRVGDREQRGSAGADMDAGGGKSLAHGGRERSVDPDRLTRRLHLRPEI